MRKFTRWDQTFSSEETNEVIQDLALCCAQELSEHIRKEFSEAIKSSDFSFLFNYDIDYSNLSLSDSINVRQILAFYTKRSDIDLGVDRSKVAYEKFIEAEELCRETNNIFQLWTQGGFSFPKGVDTVLYRASQKISKILGDVPKLSDIKPHFGPGASTQVKKQEASPRCKLGKRFACSEEFLSVAEMSLEELQGWLPDGDHTSTVSLEIHKGKLSFVPKNAKVDRAISVEPMLNSMFQLAVGAHMRDRLLAFGVDLTDQTKNQRLARVGSLTGELATLDLSSASDTVASELVYHLLPLDWAFFLSNYRTGTLEYQGKEIKLQKWSSMGNGYTFPLESLIFYALASSCVDKKDMHLVSVYGDDIIVPTSAVPLLKQVLLSVGFLLNYEKSFSSGPFRESCGADYLSGFDIRPVYLKDRLSGYDAFRLHNSFVRQGQPQLASLVLQTIEDSLKLWGPDGFGDGHLITENPPLRPHNRELGWSGYLFDTFTFKTRKSFRVSPGDYLLPRYTIYASGPLEGLPGLPAGVYDRLPGLYRGDRCFYNSITSCISYRISNKKQREWTGTNRLSDEFAVTVPGRNGYKRISIYTLIR